MPILSRWYSLDASLLLIPISLASVVLLSSSALVGGDTFSAASEFSRPNCDGIAVEDCTYCGGYTFTDHQFTLCYGRKLFHMKENDPRDSDNHYPFLWNDM